MFAPALNQSREHLAWHPQCAAATWRTTERSMVELAHKQNLQPLYAARGSDTHGAASHHIPKQYNPQERGPFATGRLTLNRLICTSRLHIPACLSATSVLHCNKILCLCSDFFRHWCYCERLQGTTDCSSIWQTSCTMLVQDTGPCIKNYISEADCSLLTDQYNCLNFQTYQTTRP